MQEAWDLNPAHMGEEGINYQLCYSLKKEKCIQTQLNSFFKCVIDMPNNSHLDAWTQ